MDTPYALYNGKIGVRIKFLTTDRNHSESLMLITSRAMRMRISRDSSSERRLRRAYLNMDALVEYKSLSREWKDALAVKFGEPEKEARKEGFAKYYVADRDASDFYLKPQFGESKTEKLDLKHVEQYIYDASVLNAVIRAKLDRKEYLKAKQITGVKIWETLSRDANAFREVPHKLPGTPGGLRRKVNNYEKDGYMSLVSGKLNNSNAKKVSKKEQMAILDQLIAHPNNLSNELIKDAYNSLATIQGWKTITAGTVANRKEKKELISLAGRKGIKSLKNSKLMQIKRSKPSAPMLYWTVDGWDVELYYQATKVNSKGHNVTTYTNRLTVVVLLDAHNNYPIGYAVGTHKTPTLIREAFQNAMNHVKELFGEYYRPYQLQTDNYAKKALTPMYNAITNNYTPAEVGNAKSKIIEPYFNRLNKMYCQLLNNWSGFGIASGSKKQPNVEVLNHKKKSFPDYEGCVAQVDGMMAMERQKTFGEYQQNWLNTKEEHKSLMSIENYLLTFGSNNKQTHKLRGEGLGVTIGGEKVWFDSFDTNLRLNSHLDWVIQYDKNDLSQALAVSTDGTERVLLEQKYIQPMALADQTQEDVIELKRSRDYNKTFLSDIFEEDAENAQIANEFMERNRIEGTLAKHLITDSEGQHKNNKASERLQANNTATKLIEKTEKKEEKKKAKNFAEEQLEYYNAKTNVNSYMP